MSTLFVDFSYKNKLLNSINIVFLQWRASSRLKHCQEYNINEVLELINKTKISTYNANML